MSRLPLPAQPGEQQRARPGGAGLAAADATAATFRRNRPVPVAARLVSGLVLLTVIGSALLFLSGVGSARPLSLREALFTAVSALTVTGLSIITPSQDLTPAGQVILYFLIQIGGVGFMGAAVIAFRLIGRSVNLMDRLALRDSLGLVDARNILRLLQYVLITVFVIQSIGALLLWLNWRTGPLGEERAALYAIFHSASAFCNAGFDLFSGLPEFPNGIPLDNTTLAIKGVLIVLGGLGIPVIADLITYPRNPHRLSLHTRITLVLVAFLIVFGGIALLAAESRPHGILADEPWGRRIVYALFQSVSARTAGFAGMPDFNSLSPASQQIMMMLMYIGCAPASMGGGITTGTFVVLVLALWGYARGLVTARVGRRRIPMETIRKAGAILTVSVILTSTATWLILLTHDVTLDRATFEVISAFATCGLSLGFTGELNGFGQAVIMFLMFWGRLGALTLVVALARRRPPDRVTYPEEQVLIG